MYVGAVPKKAADVWLQQLNACRITGVTPDTDLAAWVASLPGASFAKLEKAGLVAPRAAAREVVSLGQLTKAFTERSSSKPATVRSFKQTLDSLEACFGANTPIGLLTAEDADHWRAWVVQDKKGSGHRKKKRTTEDNRLAAATVAKRVNLTRPSGRNQRGFVTQA